ncbi:response regulator [Carboxylicivirga sp. N1Y90]|uniref:response regulator n=1 Tax=Carboxylicivirga fragile TaxID=3417571 RepID=UPI003D341D1E|nr:response regulator [Marinilabiliaceae bacterium N1Y90]
MGQFRFRGIANSIQKKVIVGFTIIILIMFVVTFMSVRGIRQLAYVVDNTEAVNELQDQINNLRLNEKRAYITGDADLIGSVDSLTNNISLLLQKINTSEINLASKSKLEPVMGLLTEFNKDFKLYASLHRYQKTLAIQTDSLYNAIEDHEVSQFQKLSKWVRPGTERYNSIIVGYNNAHSNLIAIRSMQTRVDNSFSRIANRDSLEVWFDKTLKLSFVIENAVNNIEVRSFMTQFRSHLRHYEQTIIRSINVSENRREVEQLLTKSGREMQIIAKSAAEIQSFQLSRWGELSMNYLIVMVVVAILGGILVLGFFIYTITSDERKRRNIEGAIEDNRRLLDDIINNSKALIYVKDLEGNYSLVNQNWCDEVGMAESEVIGKKANEFFSDDSVQQWDEVDQQVITSGQAVQFEEGIELKNGRRYFLSNKFPIRNTQGDVQAICGISTDITELNEALRDLEKSRENYRNIVTNVPGIVYTGLMDDSRTMYFLSSGFTKVTGFDTGNFLEGVQSFTNLIVENDRERVLETIKQAVVRNHAYEVEYRIEDVKGEMRWLHEKGMSMKQPDSSGYYLQGVMIDVTAQKEATSEVMMRDRFLEGVAEAVKELIVNQDSSEAIRKSLRIVAQSAMVDNSFIFTNIEGQDPKASHLYEWNKDQIKPINRENLQKVSYQDIGSRWYHTLSDKKEITGFREDFLEDEQFLFRELKLESLLVVPVFARDVFWGFIGFGNVSKGMPWIESHRAIFRAYTVTLGIAIAKEKDAVLLKEAKNAAEAATRAKSDFLARMSHEIRTPMNAIVGWTHLAIEKETNLGQSDYLQKIQASSKALLGIINDILDFSKIEAGKLSLESIDFDLEQVFDDLSNMVAYKAHEKGLDFIYAIDADVPLNLIGDPLRISQILVNLVNNAVKFTNKGEIVTNVLVLQEDDTEVELLVEVRDTGIGIKSDLLEFLFESFSQADVSTTRKYGGTGLGLAICKRLSGLMGGRIWVESEYGVGSSFFFTIKSKKQKVQKRNLLVPPKDLDGNQVLLINRHPVTSHIQKDMLELLNFKVTLVASCQSALVHVLEGKQDKPLDLIIVDWEIPGVKKERAIEEIIEHRQDKLPVLMLIPAFEKEKKLQQFIDQHPFVNTVVKPLNYSTLYDSCMEALGKEKSKVAWRKKEPGVYLNELKSLKEVVILLVEDNEANQMIGVELLELAGVYVEVAANGKEALSVLQKRGENYFDLILMDIQMPIMDGFDATKAILNMPVHAELPIVAMTADALEGTKQKYLEAGMVDMIAKPIDPEQVYMKVLNWVKKKRGLKQTKRRPVVVEQKPIESPKEEKSNTEWPEIKGVNVHEGVRRFANRWDFFKRLLQRFYFDHLKFVEEFNQKRDTDREVAERMLHSFKGISGTIAAPGLYDLAIKAEAAFKNNDDGFNEKFVELCSELEAILDELSKNKAVDIESVDSNN